MDRPFPEPHPLDPDDRREPRPERDPDDARDGNLEREFEERREARQIESRRRQSAVDVAEASGRLCPYGAEYVAGTWPFDPF